MQVIDFFEGPLGLITPEDSCISTTNKEGRRIKGGVTRQDLKNIPIMMVGLEALNDNMKELRNYHFGSNHILTRGLCLSEHDNVAHLDCVGGGGVGVTAILCLSGLPSDLTASILAHGTFTLSMVFFTTIGHFHWTNIMIILISAVVTCAMYPNSVLFVAIFLDTCMINRGNSRLHQAPSKLLSC